MQGYSVDMPHPSFATAYVPAATPEAGPAQTASARLSANAQAWRKLAQAGYRRTAELARHRHACAAAANTHTLPLDTAAGKSATP
jgi:hypothetical protein